MSTISRFYGILIQMYFGDHVPPHFHAIYAEFEALIDIQTFEVVRGELPRTAMTLVVQWAQQHRDELMQDWELCVQNQTPRKIRPLA